MHLQRRRGLQKPINLQTLTVDDIPNCSVSDQILLQLVTDDDADMEQLAGVIEENPHSAALVIGLANSAYFSSPTPIYTVRDSIIKVLGIQMVRNIVMSVILGRSLDLTKCPNFSTEEYWTDSLAAARYCQLLLANSNLKQFVSPDQIYLCALLAGFGELVLIHHFPAQLNKMIDCQREDPGDYIELQQQTLGISQADTGALVGQRWLLPDMVTQTMQYCFDSEYRGENWKICLLIGDVIRQTKLLRNGVTEPQLAPLTLQILGTSSTDFDLDELAGLQEELTAIAKYLVSRAQ